MKITCKDIFDEYPDNLKMDGFDDCIIGICESFGNEPRIAYDKELVLAKLASEPEMTMEDAYEWYEFNMLRAYVGPTTPVFITGWVTPVKKKAKKKRRK